jgi:hypothetical protein
MSTTTTKPITDPRTAGNSASNTANALNNDAAKKEIDEFKNTLMGGITKFLTEIGSILTVVLIWGFICANIISFVRPSSTSKSGSFTNTIMERLDRFFPHDIEKAPYGFEKTRGIADQDKITADELEKKRNAAKAADAGDEANPNKECKIDKYFVFKKDDTSTEFPYTWSAQPLIDNPDTDDPVKKIIDKNDKEKNGDFMTGERSKSFMNFALEWLVNAVYFSYGNHRQFIKTMFRMLNHYMKEKTPSSLKNGDNTKEDDESEYEYMSNLMVMLHIPIIFIVIILPFFGLGIGAIMMIAGSFWNQLPVKNYEFKFFKLLEGICMTLVVGSFTVMPFAGAAYFIQPAMFFGKLLFYQIFCEKERANLKKIFVEIVPALVTIFTLGICYSAFYNFPEPFSYVMVFGAIIAYCIVFKENISNFFMFLGMIKSNILKTKTIPKEPPTTKGPPVTPDTKTETPETKEKVKSTA